MTHYTDPDLAKLYDACNPPGPDTAFYLDYAGAAAKPVLDMGCGTGWLAASLAARGHRATGADPAEGMLAVARQRPGGERVRWVKAGARSLALEDRFDLIVMTGHAFQTLLEDAEIAASLANLRRHLSPGGIFAFETRNPQAREWESWVPERSRETVEVEGLGPVEVHYDIVAAEGEFVTYETHLRFPDDSRKVATDTIRFLPQDRLARFLAEAGFAQVTWYGDWDRSAVTPRCPELIAIAGML